MKFGLIPKEEWLDGRSPCGERGLKCGENRLDFAFVGRSPCGERGLKYVGDAVLAEFDCRSPCGERGLKYHIIYNHCDFWLCRSPCGERGLKCAPACCVGRYRLVAPRAGSVG